jgi:hypothetical protein
MKNKLVAAAMLAAAGLAAPSARADQFWSDLQAAFDTFRAGQPAPGSDYSERAVARVMDGLEGDWLEISGYGLQMGDDAAIASSCEFKSSYYEARKTTDFSFTFAKRSKSSPEEDLEYRYGFIEEDYYVRSVDTAALFKVNKRDEAGGDPSMKYYDLRMNGGGTVEIFRPSPRILVVKPSNNNTEIYAKCP